MPGIGARAPPGGETGTLGSMRMFAASTYPVRSPQRGSRNMILYQSRSLLRTLTVVPAGSVASGGRVASGRMNTGAAVTMTPVSVVGRCARPINPALRMMAAVSEAHSRRLTVRGDAVVD